MKESEIQFRALAESIPQLAWFADEHGKVYWHNQRWHEYTGIKPDDANAEVTSQAYQSLMHEDDHAEALIRFATCLKTGTSFRQEMRMKGSDNVYRWFLVQASPVHDSKGSIVRWFGTLTDIDSYKNTQKDLQHAVTESKEFLNSVLENIPHMVFVKDAQNLRFVHFNRAGEKLLGHSREKLIGKSDFDFFPEDQAKHFVEKDRMVLNSGKLDILEENITTTTGTRVIRTKKIPLLGASGKAEYLLGISEDITDWLESERSKQELLAEKIRRKEREATLEKALFLEQINSILLSSLDTKISFSALAQTLLPVLGDWCTVTTISECGKLERATWSHVDPDKMDLLERYSRIELGTMKDNPNVGHVIETGKPLVLLDVTEKLIEISSQNEELKKNLRQLGCTSCIIAPMICRGKVYGALAFVKSSGHFDQDDAYLAEEVGRKAGMAIENAFLYQTAQKAIEVRNEFLSIASHELKTPITALKLQVQMTRQKVNPSLNLQPETNKLARTLDSANDQINRLTDLVENLLDVSRIESGKISYQLEPLNVSRILRELADIYAEHLKTAGCVLTMDTLEDALVMGDKGRIEQVILNLLSNAAKYGGGNPVSLSVKRSDNMVCIIVKDQGMGIAADKINNIFDRFVRAVSSKNISGLGLGLYISREIVKAHRGDISVISELGKGTTFTVSLPLLESSSSTHSVP